MSDFSSFLGDDGFEAQQSTPPIPPGKSKKSKAPSSGYENPPYFLLLIAIILPVLSWLLSIFLAPSSGSNTIFIGFLFWLLSIASYFIPFAMFTVRDLAKQANSNYLTNDKKSHRLRVVVLISGTFFLIFPTYYLASSLASWVSAVLG